MGPGVERGLCGRNRKGFRVEDALIAGLRVGAIMLLAVIALVLARPFR